MNNHHPETMLLEKLLARYRFTRPVPPEVQDAILSSKEKILVRVLKTTGTFTALYGVFLSLYFAIKKTGAGIFLAKIVIVCTSAAALSYGAYYAASSMARDREPVPVPAPSLSLDEIRAKYEWVDQITLYNGKVLKGAITSRGETYMVLTTDGVIRVPRNQVKTVRPLNIPGVKQSPPAGTSAPLQQKGVK
jgi:hypothetical protein